jgi:hypothetical protein
MTYPPFYRTPYISNGCRFPESKKTSVSSNTVGLYQKNIEISSILIIFFPRSQAGAWERGKEYRNIKHSYYFFIPVCKKKSECLIPKHLFVIKQPEFF